MAEVEDVVLGPLADSRTRPSSGAPLGLAGLSQGRRQVGVPRRTPRADFPEFSKGEVLFRRLPSRWFPGNPGRREALRTACAVPGGAPGAGVGEWPRRERVASGGGGQRGAAAWRCTARRELGRGARRLGPTSGDGNRFPPQPSEKKGESRGVNGRQRRRPAAVPAELPHILAPRRGQDAEEQPSRAVRPSAPRPALRGVRSSLGRDPSAQGPRRTWPPFSFHPL